MAETRPSNKKIISPGVDHVLAYEYDRLEESKESEPQVIPPDNPPYSDNQIDAFEEVKTKKSPAKPKPRNPKPKFDKKDNPSRTIPFPAKMQRFFKMWKHCSEIRQTFSSLVVHFDINEKENKIVFELHRQNMASLQHASMVHELEDVLSQIELATCYVEVPKCSLPEWKQIELVKGMQRQLSNNGQLEVFVYLGKGLIEITVFNRDSSLLHDYQ
jgi:hypothetical protein